MSGGWYPSDEMRRQEGEDIPRIPVGGRKRRLQKAPVVKIISPGAVGWWVKTYFAEYPLSDPITEIWFFTRRSAERFAGDAS